MNAVMRIQVRVINGASPEIRQIQKEKTGAYQAPYYFSEATESY